MACESIPECWLGRVGDIDNNGSESPRKGYIKPVFKKDKNMEDIVERFFSQGHYHQSKQASKQKFCYSKFCCLEISLKCNASSPEEARHRRHYLVYKIVYK